MYQNKRSEKERIQKVLANVPAHGKKLQHKFKLIK